MPNQSAYQSLPPAFHQGDQAILAESITKAYDETVTGWAVSIENYPSTLLDPMTIDARLLDWRASLTPWRTLWNSDWSEGTKRSLLANTNTVFQNRYSPDLLTKLFGWFSLDAKVEPLSGFILGTTGMVPTPSPLPATLGTGLTSYRVRVPKYYTPGTIERGLVNFLVSRFGAPLAIEIVVSS